MIDIFTAFGQFLQHMIIFFMPLEILENKKI